MKFVFPIEGKKASDLYTINRDGVGGFYPIGLHNSYHGGLHIDGNHAVVAIADGTVVAYRYTKTCLEETLENKKYTYSNCFILIRHEYTTPKGQKLTFYSHYCHLCPWDEFSEEQKKRLPELFAKSGFKITATSLSVRSSPKKDDNLVKGKELKSDAVVVAAAVDEKWAKIEGAEEYFAYKNYATPISIACAPVFDKIESCEIPVKAGTLLGYSGKFETEGAPEKYTTVHVEIFAGDDTEKFVHNTKEDGDKKPTQLQVASGAQLKVKELKYDPVKIKSKHIIIPGTSLKILNNSNSEYMQVQELKLQTTITKATKESCLSFVGQKKYKIKWEKVQELSDAFNGFEFEKTDTISFNHYINEKGQIVATDAAPKRMISFDVPEKRAEQCWVKRSALKIIKDSTAIAEAVVNETYTANPALVKFEKTAGTVAEETHILLKDTKTALDEQNGLWYKVMVGSSEGWIADNDISNIKKLSAFDWPGFKIAKEEGDNAFDPVIDVKNLTPFFKKIVDEINVDKDKSTISKEEMQGALKNEKLANKLSHLICFHQSEWWVDKEMTYWEPVFKKLGKGKTAEQKVENLKARIKSLCWWDGVAAKVKGFPAAPNVYHFHPVAFVENMREINVRSAPWMQIALSETLKAKGVSEKAEPLYSMVEKYLNHIGIKDDPKTTKKEDEPSDVAWCAAFVSWCLDQTEYKSPRTARSREYLADDNNNNAKSKDLLYRVADSIYGAIAVFSDCDSTGNLKAQGHAGFVYGKLSNGKIAIIGGNQGDRLKLSEYDCSGNVFLSYTTKNGTKHYKKFRGYYLPKDYGYIDADKICDSDTLEISDENKKLTNTAIEESADGESSR